jgi:hypothetical protein
MQTHEIHLELRLDGPAPTGLARLAGGEARPFSGWIGLVSAVETLITAEREPASPTSGSAA